MLIREFALVVLLFPPTLLGNDYRWYRAVEFWSSVICSMENSKTVHFHGVLDNYKSSILFERCFEAFVRSIARKCSTTIVLRTYTFPDSGNTSFVDDNNVICGIAKEPSMWKITSNDKRITPFLITSARVERIQNDKAFGKNTWNVHVILAKNIRSFDKISKDGSTFEWKPYDRFIILIVCQEEMLYKSKLDDILKTLWSKHKMQSILVAETIAVADDTRIDQAIRIYNPFAKVNDSAYGRIEIINVKTVGEASSLLSHLSYYQTNNMNGYELKTGIFSKDEDISEEEKMRLSKRSNNNRSFKEIDQIILNTIAEHMNFTYRQMLPKDNKFFGYQLPNGTYVGAIGDVIYGRTDICFESFFIKKYSTDPVEDVSFSVYMDFDKVCVIVPKATKIPKGLRLYHFFPLSVWICTMLSQIFVYLTWYFLQIFTPGRTKKLSFSATIYRLFLLNMGCSQKWPNTNAERILLSGILLTNITITSLFSGILYNSFAHDMYYPDIETLHDFDASGLLISLASLGLADIFDDDNSSMLMRNLQNKLRYGENAANNTAYYRNGSGLVKENYFPFMDARFVDEDGSPLLHLIKECPGAFFLSYLLPKNSILQDGINTWIGRMNQAGLTLLWKKQTIRTLVMEEKAEQKKRKAEKKTIDFVPFNLSDVQSSFYMLLIGLSVSAIVFLHEKGWLRSRSLLRTKKSNSESTIGC